MDNTRKFKLIKSLERISAVLACVNILSMLLCMAADAPIPRDGAIASIMMIGSWWLCADGLEYMQKTYGLDKKGNLIKKKDDDGKGNT